MSDNENTRKRLTGTVKKQRDDFAERESRTKEWISDQVSRASKLRSKDKEFYGLEREFIHLQKKMLQDFEISKDIKHPRDVGTVREELLRCFFNENKLLPQTYAISKSSVRVASTSGHLSNEIDILFYDAFNSFSLMQRQEIFEVLPVEFCYGVIQVKSKLTKKELKSAFENIRSFKKLKKHGINQNIFIHSEERIQANGFGIIFAYDTDMDWMDIVQEIKTHSQNFEKNVLPNAIFILTKGFFMFGSDDYASVYNSDIEILSDIKPYGYPDREGVCLYQLYDITFNLLSKTKVQKALPQQYFRLPLTAGDYSYEYTLGHFSELGRCEKHGDYVKAYTPEKLEKIISWCQNAEPINWIKATHLAYGQPGDDIEAYERQPGDVRIYNPNDLPLSDILLMDKIMEKDGEESIVKVLAFDSIKTCGLNIYIPYYYIITEKLIEGCKKCNKSAAKK